LDTRTAVFRAASDRRESVIRALVFAEDAIFSRPGGLRAGAEDFIRACAKRFPLLLTAHGSYADNRNALAALGLAPLFLDILSEAEVEQRQPAPDLLIAALGRIGFLLRDRNPLEPAECLVVECSPAGIKAARRAHMRCLAIAHSVPAAALTSADFVRDSFVALDLDEILRGCA
jgi:beta-phosphoglucomutase-like phosphatase (HAD superfamily)